MTLWPASLVGRMTTVVVVLGLLSFALHLALLAAWMRPIGDELVDGLVHRVALERELLRAQPGERRAAMALSLSGPTHRLAPADGRAEDTAAPRLPLRHVIDRLREVGAARGIAVAFASDEGQPPGHLHLHFDVDGQRWRAEHQVVPPAFGLLGTWSGWLALLAAGVIASLVLGVRLVGRPLHDIARQIGAQRGALQPLAAPPGAATELRTLVESFNRLVDAVRRADATQQQLLAGVSHDLRTPLARLQLRIETQCEPRIAEVLTADLKALERIVSQFLAYVHGGGLEALGRRAPLAGLVAQVVGQFQSAGRPVRTTASDVVFEVADLPVLRALTNLIDNALSHGRPPVDVVLARRLSARGDEVMLTVWDRGAGLSEADFERAQQPFVRLSGGGAELGHCGLGLAIAAQMAHQLGATLHCCRDAQGRFGISIVWPARQADTRSAVS